MILSIIILTTVLLYGLWQTIDDIKFPESPLVIAGDILGLLILVASIILIAVIG